MASIDAYGTATNSYPTTRALTAEPPAGPWAMNLADASGVFRFLCFDLDASLGRAEHDARRLEYMLGDLGIAYVVTESGPSGGRHIWIALQDGAPADFVKSLALQLKGELATLDYSCLANPQQGAARPPGAPHRDGGASRVIRGTLATLSSPTVELEDLQRLHALLVEANGGRTAVPDRSPADAAIAIDAHGYPYLAIPSRELGAATRHLIESGTTDTDQSRMLAAALARCAAAGLRFHDVERLAEASPAFEHVRTAAQSSGRRRTRSATEAHALLQRQWARQVQWVATRPAAIAGDDDTFNTRAGDIATLVTALQERADAMPGRWNGAGGLLTDRLVLDALSTIALQSLQGAVDASARRLSAIAGVGRETARTALLRLADEGWIALEAEADGSRASKWRLRDFSTTPHDTNRSQVPPPPPGTGTSRRNLLLRTLATRLETIAHDTFSAPRSLGRLTGLIYSQLQHDELHTQHELHTRTRLSHRTLRRHLDRLTAHGLVDDLPGGYVRSSPDTRDAAAQRLGVDGYLEDRQARYLVEREAWTWWQSELERRHTKRSPRRRRRADQPVLYLVDDTNIRDYPIHPTRRDGRADFAAALRVIRDGALQAPQLEEAATAA